MPQKEKFGILSIGAVCGALIAIVSFWSWVDGRLDYKIRSVAKSQIEIQNAMRDKKMEVLYRYNMAIAKKSETTAEIWDDIAKEVEADYKSEIPTLKDRR